MKAPFTADLCALAIIAACASYGDDPIKAMTAPNSFHRRGLTAAGAAIQIVTGVSRVCVSRALGLGLTSIVNSDAKGRPAHLKAKTAALAALGGATAVLAPEPGRSVRAPRPDPETVSDLPDQLLAPRPMAPPIIVEVVESQALPAPVAPPPTRSARNTRIRDLIDRGWTNREIAAEIGVTIGVVAGQRQRLCGAAKTLSPSLKPPRKSSSAVARPAKADGALLGARATPAVRFERLEPTRDDRIPNPTRDAIAPTDQALIAEALAKGNLTKLPTAVAEGGFAHGVAVSQPAPLGFDPVKRKYSRGEGATQSGGFNR